MTTNTAALLRHLADVLTALQPARWYITNPDKRRDFFAASTRLAQSLDLHEGAALVDIAPHVRAHADSLAPGLPEGWSWQPYANIGAHCFPPGKPIIEARIVGDCLELFGPVPLSVVRAVLARAQGVGS